LISISALFVLTVVSRRKSKMVKVECLVYERKIALYLYSAV